MYLRNSVMLVVFFALASVVGAQQTSINPDTDNLRTESGNLNLTHIQKEYNSRSDQVPDFVGALIGDQTITINLSQTQSTEDILKQDVIGVKTEGVKTKEISYGVMENPTLELWITQKNIETLSKAENRQQKLKQMIQNRDIRYETNSLGMKIKVTVMNFFMSL